QGHRESRFRALPGHVVQPTQRTSDAAQHGRRPEMDILGHSGCGGLGIVLAAAWRRAPAHGNRRRAMMSPSGTVRGMVLLLAVSGLQAAPKAVSFLQSTQTIDAYDFVEVTVQVTQPDARNPFTDVAVNGSFTKQG